MATSQNGYRANDRSLIASYSIPGGRIAVRKGDVATVLTYIAERFHREVEPLVWPGNWGYAERPIRGSSTTLSNHASGTAIDLNAPRHPLGKRGTFTRKQQASIRRILDDLDGTVRWGGDYKSRADEMHFEINASTSRVAAVAKKIRGGLTVTKPAPAPTKKEWYDDMKQIREFRGQRQRIPARTSGNVLLVNEEGLKYPVKGPVEYVGLTATIHASRLKYGSVDLSIVEVVGGRITRTLATTQVAGGKASVTAHWSLADDKGALAVVADVYSDEAFEINWLELSGVRSS